MGEGQGYPGRGARREKERDLVAKDRHSLTVAASGFFLSLSRSLPLSGPLTRTHTAVPSTGRILFCFEGSCIEPPLCSCRRLC